MTKYGDENIAGYDYRVKNPTAKDLPEELKEREAHKYDLYSKFD
jgi:hypothetical protein